MDYLWDSVQQQTKFKHRFLLAMLSVNLLLRLFGKFKFFLLFMILGPSEHFSIAAESNLLFLT